MIPCLYSGEMLSEYSKTMEHWNEKKQPIESLEKSGND